MEEPMLAVISLTMFVGSYFAGFIPLFFPLNERWIRVASIFGAGLLVGTAFCVIIPEGIASLIESSSQSNTHATNPAQHLGNLKNEDIPKANEEIVDKVKKRKTEQEEDLERRGIEKNWDEKKRRDEIVDGEASGGSEKRRRRRRRGENEPIKAAGVEGEEVKRPKAQEQEPGNERGHPDEKKEEKGSAEKLNGIIGVSLLVGFLFMHVIDQLSKLSQSRHKTVPTLGLVIHAFADGIAMGSASSAGSQLELQILVFVAIMLHKAPTAFALVSILLAGGLDKARVRRHLLIFSLAAPIGTILTYAFLHTAKPSSPSTGIHGTPDVDVSSNFTGMILLFSAGTFLYIATVHVLPELIDSKCSSALSGSGMSGSREMLLGGGDKVSSSSRFSLAELCLFCASALIPAFISSSTHGHAHAH